MKFVCDGCQTRYSIADEKVRQRILRIRCKTCGHVITVQSGEVIAGPQDYSGRTGADAGPSPSSAARPSSGLSRASAGAREWFVAVDGKEQGPLTRTDAAKVIVSLQPEKSVRVWKEGMDGWKRPSDVAILAQEISVLRRSPLDAPLVGSSSALRPAPARTGSVSGVRAPGSRPKPLPTGTSGSGPKLAQPGSGLKSPPVSGSGLKAAPPPFPGSGPKAVPPAISGSAPKAVPPAISGSGPKAVPPPIPGSQPKARPSVPAQLVTAGSSSPSLKKGPALPGVTPMSSAHSAPETEFDKAPATRPEKRPSAPLAVVASGAPVAATVQPAAPRDGGADDEFDQAQKTPPSGHPLPPIVDAVGAGHSSTAPLAGVHLPVLPQPANFSAGGPSAAAAIRPSSLFGNVALAPPEPWRTADAQSGLSKLAALTRRHRHLKYVVAASAVVVLVIFVILLSWRTDSGKGATAASKPEGHAPEVAPLAKVEPLPQDESAVAPGAEPKGRTATRSPRRQAAVHSAGSSVKAAAVGEDPFEGPSAPSHSTERPAPVVTPDQSRRSHSGPSGGAVREVSQSQISEVVRNKENQAGLKTCYERALKRDGRLRAGRLDITVSIGAMGSVQSVQVHGPSDFLIIEGCIKNAVRHWHFPANVDEYATSFPLILQGG
jgi:predicted Zn finger-like uncharacterized protein